MYARLRRIEARVTKLLEKRRAGTYRASAPAIPTPPARPPPKRDPRAWVFPEHRQNRPRRRCKPAGFGWMNRPLPYNGPGIQAFAKTCPALARQLRPLCYMLGVTLPVYLKLPPRPRKPRPPKPEKREKFAPYTYAMRTGPTFGERLRRFAKKRVNGRRTFAYPFYCVFVILCLKSSNEQKFFVSFFKKESASF